MSGRKRRGWRRGHGVWGGLLSRPGAILLGLACAGGLACACTNPPPDPPDEAAAIGAEEGMSPFAPRPATSSGAYLRQGAVVEQAVDLNLPGPMEPWTQTRTYSSLGGGSTQLGGKWVSSSGDFRLVQVAGGVALISNATGKRVFEEGMEGYTAPSDSTFDIDVDEENGEFILTDAVRGDLFVFYDFSGSHGGLLKERSQRSWREAGKDGALYTYNSSSEDYTIDEFASRKFAYYALDLKTLG